MDGFEQCKRKRTGIVKWAYLPFPVGFARVKRAEEIVDWQQNASQLDETALLELIPDRYLHMYVVKHIGDVSVAGTQQFI